MEIYVLDKELNIVNVISKYEAIIWKDILDKPGRFEAEFLFTIRNSRTLKRTNILYKTDEMQAGIINYRHIKLNKEGRVVIRIKGGMASSYLNRRIVWNKMVLSGTSEEAMRELVEAQVINPSNPKRKMPRIRLGEVCGIEDHIEKQVTYANLQETLTEIASEAGLGYILRLDLKEKVFYFEVIRGKDRTIGTTKPCLFSRYFKNIDTQEYYEDDSNYKNVCLVCGKGEDEDRTTVEVGDASGIDRYEMAYSAAFLEEKGQTEEAYIAQLFQKGSEKLKEFFLVQSLESKIRQSKAPEYGMGDIATCLDNEWGIRMDAQIKQIEKHLSKNERKVYITFGNSRPMLTELIKATIK